MYLSNSKRKLEFFLSELDPFAKNRITDELNELDPVIIGGFLEEKDPYRWFKENGYDDKSLDSLVRRMKDIYGRINDTFIREGLYPIFRLLGDESLFLKYNAMVYSDLMRLCPYEETDAIFEKYTPEIENVFLDDDGILDLGRYWNSYFRRLSSRIKERLSEGDLVSLGAYSFDYGGRERPLVWMVLENNDEEIRLMSLYALDIRQFHALDEEIGPKDSDLYHWLNEDFFDAAFDEDEKSLLVSDRDRLSVFLPSLIDMEKSLIPFVKEECRFTPNCESCASDITSLYSGKTDFWIEDEIIEGKASFIGYRGIHAVNYLEKGYLPASSMMEYKGVRPLIRIRKKEKPVITDYDGYLSAFLESDINQ